MFRDIIICLMTAVYVVQLICCRQVRIHSSCSVPYARHIHHCLVAQSPKHWNV